MEYNYGELERLFYDIQDIIGYFEQSQYDKRRFNIYLCNGDRLNFRVSKEHVAHLLGVNTAYLKTIGCFSGNSSFELLKELCDNAYRINELYKTGVLNYNNLFSKHITEKIEGFRQNIKVNIYETQLVCKYNSERTYTTTDKNQKYDYIIVKKYEDTNKYGILCLVKNNDYGYYAPMSNQLFDSVESLNETLEELIKNQEITLMNGVTVSNTEIAYNKPYILPIDIKLTKLINLKQYKEKFNCSIDVSSDLEYSLSETQKHINNHYDNNDLIEIIAQAIENGRLIENIEKYGNTKLIKVVNAHNDTICSHIIESNSEVGLKYSEIKEELESYKEQLLKYREQNSKLIEEKEELINKNANLDSQNRKYHEREQKMLELLIPTSKPSK